MTIPGGHMMFDDPSMAGLLDRPIAVGTSTDPQQGGLLAPRAKRPPMVQRVMNSLRGLLQGGDEAPPGYDSLLGQEDIQAARPGLLTSIVAPGAISKSIWGSNMDNVVKMRMLAQQLADQRTQKQAQAGMLKNRERVFQQFQLPPDATPEQRQNAMRAMITEFTRNGDVEMIKGLDSIGSKLFDPANVAKKPALQAVKTGEQIETFNPDPDFVEDPTKPFGGRYTPGPKQAMNADELEIARLKAQEARMRMQAAASEAQVKMGESDRRSFDSMTKGLQTAAQSFGLFDAAVESSQPSKEFPNGNPAAVGSAIINFAGSTDKGLQMRQGILQFVASKLSGSAKGRIDMATQMLANGTLPPQVMRGMIEHVNNVRRNTIEEYTKRRAAILRERPGSAAWILPAEDVFGPAPTVDALQPGSKVKRFLPGTTTP